MDFVFTLSSFLPFAASTGAVEDSDRDDFPKDFGGGGNGQGGYCVVAELYPLKTYSPSIRPLIFPHRYVVLVLRSTVVFGFTLFGNALHVCV
ncbi:hypothetical protein B0J17DRAFT_721011 [Rhizoctonia solani]|nr:hypothetical protein B0J17DRAFT_721011 [Rhizoctonia solani]